MEKKIDEKALANSPTTSKSASKNPLTTRSTNPSSSMPVKCHVCGKLFGKNSVRFHVPQCEKKHQAMKAREEKEKLERKKSSSYIIYEDFETDTSLGMDE